MKMNPLRIYLYSSDGFLDARVPRDADGRHGVRDVNADDVTSDVREGEWNDVGGARSII